MSEKESEKIIVIGGYQARMDEGYQPKCEKIDPKTLKPPKGGTAASKPQIFVSEKKDE
ncbi:MAG: hypothetical protein QME07_00670 [bacterium]|nr:hypothetical protein [bacterium]